MSFEVHTTKIYCPRPTVLAITSTHGPLSWLRLACKQASILPPPGCTSPQSVLMSPRHWLATAAAPTKTARHGCVRSAKCELRQDRIAPAPGGTSPHAALMSAAHSLLISPCCAIAHVVDSNMMAPIAKTVFGISFAPCCLPVVHSQFAEKRGGIPPLSGFRGCG